MDLITQNPIASLIYDISDRYYRKKVYLKYKLKKYPTLYIKREMITNIDNFNKAIKIINNL